MTKEEAKSSINAEKLKVLNPTLEKREKTFGKGAIMRRGETPIEAMDVISTGDSVALVVIRIAGARGRVRLSLK